MELFVLEMYKVEIDFFKQIFALSLARCKMKGFIPELNRQVYDFSLRIRKRFLLPFRIAKILNHENDKACSRKKSL